MENHGTAVVAHNGTGAQVEIREGTASTRLYKMLHITMFSSEIACYRVTVGLFWYRRCDIN